MSAEFNCGVDKCMTLERDLNKIIVDFYEMKEGRQRFKLMVGSAVGKKGETLVRETCRC